MEIQDNVHDFMQRLADDDAFREQVQADPIAALATCGFVLDPTHVPNKVELPTKVEIDRSALELNQKKEGKSGWIVFCR